MGWFSRKSAPVAEVKSELTDPTSDSWAALCDAFAVSASGVSVNADSAMRCAPVNAAVSILSESTATLPCRLLRDDANDSERAAKGHPAYSLVNGFSNEWSSAADVRRRVTQDAILFGDGFALVTRTADRPAEILYAPRSVVVLEYQTDGEPRYRIDGKVYGPRDVIHLQVPNPNDPLQQRGLGLLHTGRDAIGLAILLERSSSNLFRNNSKPSGVLSVKGSLNATAAARMATAWRSAHSGDKAGSVAIIDNDGSYTPINFTSVDSQTVEQRAYAVSEISRLTRVPATLLSDMSRATWSNSVQLDLQFIKYGLQPWLRAWCDAYARCLLSPDERTAMHFEFDMSQLLLADTVARANAFAQYRSAGVMTANDVRRELNLPPLPDGDVLASPHVQSPANDNQPPKDQAA
ncbi:phage portal protein [Nitrobacter hamburgensis X14]|uniref:Phage portal protein n=1 Tax=Nitrobacter hamburgensis (strain DSM 10229 / NCIMB 13809 / X14) TaxID=323097 RepID=Q1QLS2_NITHX|nr:phage portal protein [Nitrobacter hamburgensis]ABE62825.1 phage portal protein [Nitrobacter hamburgensis X14]